MDNSSVCTLNILEVKPSRAKCVPGHSCVCQLVRHQSGIDVNHAPTFNFVIISMNAHNVCPMNAPDVCVLFVLHSS